MKRLIKFWNRYQSDGAKFSTCSTEYELLPVLVDDNAGFEELKALAKEHGIKLGRKKYQGEVKPKDSWRSSLIISHAINTTEIKEAKYKTRDNESYVVHLGFITLDEKGILKPKKSLNNKITRDDALEIVNLRKYGVSDYGETVDGKMIIVKENWNYFHDMTMLGYPVKNFEKALKAENDGFEDDTDMCSDCGKFDSRDNGYSNNFRYVDSRGNLGLNCGCFDEFCASDDAIEHYKDSSQECMELSGAKTLQKQGKLKHLERFIGGWVDGRGGYFGGEYTREGKPDEVLKEYQEKYPNKSFIFTHDESGQFQTYFSIWEVVKKPKKRKAA
jgi:hypothetical protein